MVSFPTLVTDCGASRSRRYCSRSKDGATEVADARTGVFLRRISGPRFSRPVQWHGSKDEQGCVTLKCMADGFVGWRSRGSPLPILTSPFRVAEHLA
jgi:hypothetical protein